MLAIERKQKILEKVVRERRVVVSELSDQFGVTEETIRRDLNGLEKDGLLSRTHGGAVSRATETEDLPYGTRHLINLEAKHAIAAKVATIVKDGQSIFMDSSSTVYESIGALQAHHDLTLITNSPRLFSDPDVTSHTVISVGGELRRRSLAFVGPLTTQSIAQFNADIALISCKALSVEQGIMEANIADAEVKRAFIRSARQVCLLVDGDKFDQTALVTVSTFEDIDIVVTDRQPATRWVQLFKSLNVELFVSDR